MAKRMDNLRNEKGASARHLVLMFLAAVAVCAVFFSLGFVVGYNHAPSRAALATENVAASGNVPPTVNPPAGGSSTGGMETENVSHARSNAKNTHSKAAGEGDPPDGRKKQTCRHSAAAARGGGFISIKLAVCRAGDGFKNSYRCREPGQGAKVSRLPGFCPYAATGPRQGQALPRTGGPVPDTRCCG